MGVFGKLFKVGADTIKGTLEGAGELAKDIRAAIKNDLPAEKAAELEAKLLEIEAGVKKAQADVIMAEANGDSFLQKNWRPMVMLFFAVLIGMTFFGLRPEGVTDEIFIELMGLLKIGLGGYVIGQSAEIVADKWNKS